MATFRPSDLDHDVISQRYIINADQLPETTETQLEKKQAALEKEKDAVQNVIAADMLGDKTDQSALKVYDNPEKTKIVQTNEWYLDKELQRKVNSINATLARIKEKLDAIHNQTVQIAASTSPGANITTRISTNRIRSAENYLRSTPERKKRTKRVNAVRSITQ